MLIRLATYGPLALLALYLALFTIQLHVFGLWGPFSTIDEQLQYYQAGRNFAHYGFLPTAFLPDLSTGSEPSQHPYVYNHQPPGPQLLIGALLSLFGERYRLIRLVFAALFTIGILVYLRFCRTLAIAGPCYPRVSFLFVTPWAIMHVIDHPAYSLFPLAAFAPIVLLHRAHEQGTRWLRVVAAGISFLAASYLITGPLFMILALWSIGSLSGFLPMTRRDLRLLLAAAALALALHLFQTVALIGPRLFLQEAIFTLMNRISGHPTREDLMSFYDSIAFVLYGGHRFSASVYAKALLSNLTFPGHIAVFLTLVIALSTVCFRAAKGDTGARARRSVQQSLKTIVVVVAAVLTPLVMFPAYASDYGLNGVNEFLLAIIATTVLSLASTIRADQARRVFHRLLSLMLFVTLAWSGLAQSYALARTARDVARWALRPGAEQEFARLAETLAGQVTLTNVDPTVVGFFTQAAALGGCQRPVIAASLPDATACAVRFIRGWPATMPAPPTAYVWFAEGHAFCSPPECLTRDDLTRRFPTLFSTARFSVFRLQ